MRHEPCKCDAHCDSLFLAVFSCDVTVDIKPNLSVQTCSWVDCFWLSALAARLGFVTRIKVETRHSHPLLMLGQEVELRLWAGRVFMFPEKCLRDIRASINGGRQKQEYAICTTAELWSNTGLLRIMTIYPGSTGQCIHGLMQHVSLLRLEHDINQTALTDSLFKSKFTCEVTATWSICPQRKS